MLKIKVYYDNSEVSAQSIDCLAIGCSINQPQQSSNDSILIFYVTVDQRYICKDSPKASMLFVFAALPERSCMFVIFMCENFLSLFKNCSSDNKKKLSSFLQDLFPQQGAESTTTETKLESIFLNITRDFSLAKVRELSKNERSKKELINYQYSYGQITFKTIHQIISKIKALKPLGSKQIFYDLGSGSGKVLLAASLSYPFEKCKGIEYLQSLYQISLALKKKSQEGVQRLQQEVSQVLKEEYKMPAIEIYNQNFQKMNWSDGTVIFVSSTCYTRQMMLKIEQLCQKLRSGTILITLTRSIENFNNNWRLLDKFQGDTSWGTCTVFIHMRGQ